MFNKLLSNLPYNPSLISQVSFYTKRLRQEAAIRRLGFAFMALAMSVQLFAFIAPPKSTIASSNDIVFGGIDTSNPKAMMLSIYDSDSDGVNTGFRALFRDFEITREDIANTTPGTINSGDHQLYSLGRNPSPNASLDQSTVVGGQQYWLRPLFVWGDHHSYPALIGTRSGVIGTSEDRYFAIMIECGNIVVKMRPQPKLAIAKVGLNHTNGASVQRGELLQYRVFFSNIGSGSAHFVTVTDGIPQYTSFVSQGRGGADSVEDHSSSPAPPFAGQPSSKYFGWIFGTMPGQTERWYVDLNVRVDTDAPIGKQICNSAFVRSLEVSPVQTNGPICYTVAAPPSTSKPSTPTNPIIPIVPPTNSTPAVPQPGQPNISKSKLVSNITKNISDANNTVANPKDILQYQVLTINSGDSTAPDYNQLTDNVNDILEYANVTEISDGGTLKNGVITWKATDIKAKSTLTRTFKIQIKDPIPATPQSKSDPQSYDLQLDNTYGNTVSVKVPSPTAAKTVEMASTKSIPNTGPGSTLIIGFSLTVIIGYFLARSRLMTQELVLVHAEQTSGGI